MNKCFIYIFILFHFIFLLPAQSDQRYIDSLSAYLTKPDDSLKLLAISDLAWEYNSSDVKKSISLSFKAVDIAKKLKRNYAIGQAYSDLGTSYYYKRDFDSSAYFYLKAEKITLTIGDSMELASLYNKLGALYKERAEYKISIDYSFKSLKIYEAIGNNRKIALLLNNIGVTYEELKNFSLSADYYKRALDYNLKENNESGVGRNYIGLGNVSTTLKQFDNALSYYQKAEIIFRKLQWPVELSVALNNMGDVLDEKKLYAQSVIKRTEALEIAKEIEDIQGQAKYHLYIGDVLMKMGKFAEAQKHIKDSEALSKNIQSYEIQMDLYELYSKYYFGTNNFDKGSEYLQKFHAIKDSVYTADLSANVADMEVKHNTQKLRLEKAETETQNLKLFNDNLLANQQRNYILIVSGCLLLIAGFGFYFYGQKQKLIEDKKRINAMLESEEKERARIARELHDGLGQLLSTARLNAAALEDSVDKEDESILKNTLYLIDQSVSEVRNISHNLMPQVLADKGLMEALTELVNKVNASKTLAVNFNYFGFNSSLNKPIEIAIYRVIQEVLNNMIRHSAATIIDLTIADDSTHLKIEIVDNGKGFDAKLVTKSNGIGWKNIATRLSLINGKFNINSQQGSGTQVNIDVII